MTTSLIRKGSQEYEAIELIERSHKLSPSTKVKYTRVLRKYFATGKKLKGESSARDLREFAETLSGSQRAFLKAGVRKWADEFALEVKAQSTPETRPAVAATLDRLDALKSAIELEDSDGYKLHTWLSREQVIELKSKVGNGIMGARDRAVIGLMVGAGLRRDEVCSLTFEDIETLPNGDGERSVIHVLGKGSKARSIPISKGLAADLSAWGEYVEHTGPIARALGPKRELSDGAMSGVAVFKVVRKYGKLIDKSELAPHDMRRTFAKLAYNDGQGVSLPQLSMLLGHADVNTTVRYLGIEVDLHKTASDLIPW